VCVYAYIVGKPLTRAECTRF